MSRSPLDEWSACHKDLYLTTHQTHKIQTSMTPSGIRTQNPSKWAMADPCCILPSHWDRLMFYIVTEICQHIVTLVTVRQKNNPLYECLCTYMYTWFFFVLVMECAVRFEVLVVVLVKIILLGCDNCEWARISWLFKDNSVFFFLNCFTLKVKALWSFKTLRNTCPVTQHHIPEGFNLWTVFSLRYRLRLKE